MKTYLRFFGWAIWLITLVPILFLAIALLSSSITARGILFAISVLLIWIAFPFSRSNRRGFAITGMALLTIGAVTWISLGSFGSSERIRPDAKFQSIYDGTAKFRKRSIAQIVPESDQLLTGAKLFPLIDPFYSHQQSRQLGKQIRTIYREMRSDPDFRNTGSALGLCYREIFSGQTPTGHRYQYFPEEAGDKIPAILFLHGSLGNFKGYQWILKEFADEQKVAIIAPSFGMGEWRNDRGMNEIKKSLEFCLAHPEIDPRKIFFGGISNGGAGMTMALPEVSEHIAGLIYISPVLEPEKVKQPEFLSAVSNKPVFLITGRRDRRIPEAIVREGITSIASTTEVETHFVEEEDHFLFFSKREMVCERLGKWFESQAIR